MKGHNVVSIEKCKHWEYGRRECVIISANVLFKGSKYWIYVVFVTSQSIKGVRMCVSNLIYIQPLIYTPWKTLLTVFGLKSNFLKSYRKLSVSESLALQFHSHRPTIQVNSWCSVFFFFFFLWMPNLYGVLHVVMIMCNVV